MASSRGAGPGIYYADMEDEARLPYVSPDPAAAAEAAVQPLLMTDQPPTATPSPTEQDNAMLINNKHRISNVEAILHLVKATIGGGFLAMPDAFHNAGIMVGTIGTLVVGLSVLNMMSSIVRISQALRSGRYAAAVLAERNGKIYGDDSPDNGGDSSPDDYRRNIGHGRLVLPPMDYPDTVAAVFERGAHGRFSMYAPLAKYFTGMSLISTYYGVNIIYVCIVAETLKQFVDQYTAQEAGNPWADSLNGLSIRWYPAVAAFLITPVGMVRLMKYMVPFSMVANTCLVTGALAVFYYIFVIDNEMDPLEPEHQAKLVVWPMARWTLFTGSALCSMEGVGMLLHIENVMKHPLQLAGPPSYTLHKSMIVIMVANGVMGLIGYRKYGDKCEGSISLNLPSNNTFSSIVKGIIAAGILLTYGLQLTVTADLAWKGMRNTVFGKRSAGSGNIHLRREDDDRQKLRTNVYYYGMRMLLIIGTILVATALPDIGPLVSLVGSVGFSVLGLIIPVIMETIWYWDPKDEAHDGYEVVDEDFVGIRVIVSPDVRRKLDRRRRAWRIFRHIKNAALILLALCSLAGGTYFNVQALLGEKKTDGTPV